MPSVLLQSYKRGSVADLRELRNRLRHVIQPWAKEKIIPLLKKTVMFWDHQPSFYVRQSVSSSQILAVCVPWGPNAKYWTYVVLGRGPRLVKRRQKAFTPSSSYVSHTHPGSLSSGIAVRGHAVLVYSKSIWLGSIESRDFPELIADEVSSEIEPDIQREINSMIPSIQVAL